MVRTGPTVKPGAPKILSARMPTVMLTACSSSRSAHANGSLYVVFGHHAHRLGPDCQPLSLRRLPRERPYNSFVILADGHLATKDFAKDGEEPSELLVLEPDQLEIVARLPLPERSIARLTGVGTDVYVVGDTSLLRAHWDGAELLLDGAFRPRYRCQEGPTYGWDAVVDAGAAWFLDDGEGTERYTGTFTDRGVSEAPLHLVRCDLGTGEVLLTEICGLPAGIVANPPAIDPERHIAVGYDSTNGALCGFRFDDTGRLTPLWQRRQNHGGHMLRFADTGELATGHHDARRGADQVVVIDIETRVERARADTGSPVQSVLFPAPGLDRDFYVCSFTTLTRVGAKA